ncbi:MAG: 4Fe-4S binding protein [Thermodesulfovibrionales bacterium]
MGSTANEITMFIDTSKCIGCKACQVACKQWHSLPAETDEGTATTGTATTLVDVARTPTAPPFINPLSWAINQWAGRGVEIISGAGVGQKRTITSNTADTLTVSPVWGTIPGGTSIYALSTVFTGSYTNPPDMSGNNLTVVKFNETQGLGGLKFLFLKDQCQHCYQPKCKRGCPGGVYKTSEGFVLFSSNCNDAHLKPRKKPNPLFGQSGEPKTIPMTFAEHCPYDIPRLSTTLNQYVKCDFCYDRFASSDTTLQRDKSSLGISRLHTTACEFACPSGAIVTGSYAQVIAGSQSYAKRRYRAIIRAYPFARLYTGYKGRTNVIYLLTEPADKYGLPTTEKSI